VQQQSGSSAQQLQAKSRGVVSGASGGATKESVLCVVCIFWNNVTTL